MSDRAQSRYKQFEISDLTCTWTCQHDHHQHNNQISTNFYSSFQIYIQLCKQCSENPRRESLRRGYLTHIASLPSLQTLFSSSPVLSPPKPWSKVLIGQVGAAGHLFGFLPSLRQLLPLPTQFHTEGEQSIDLFVCISPILIILDSYFPSIVSILSSSSQHRDPTMDFPEGGRWPIHVQVRLVKSAWNNRIQREIEWVRVRLVKSTWNNRLVPRSLTTRASPTSGWSGSGSVGGSLPRNRPLRTSTSQDYRSFGQACLAALFRLNLHFVFC